MSEHTPNLPVAPDPEGPSTGAGAGDVASPVREPVVVAGLTLALFTAALNAAVGFGLPITAEQATLLGAVASAVSALVVALVGHNTTSEYVAAGDVRRGAANEGTTGEYVRQQGVLPVITTTPEGTITTPEGTDEQK